MLNISPYHFKDLLWKALIGQLVRYSLGWSNYFCEASQNLPLSKFYAKLLQGDVDE